MPMIREGFAGRISGSRPVRSGFSYRGWFLAPDRADSTDAPPWTSRPDVGLLTVRPGPVSDRHRAFLDLTGPHLDAVYNIARRRVRDPGRAEDLVQETYLRAFAAFDDFRGGSPRSWLVAICLNAVRSDARRSRCRPVEDLSIDLIDGEASSSDTCDAALDSLARDVVRDALDQLPDAQRISITLVDLGGLTAQEAADALGCPRGTVLARVHRGRRQLARILTAAGVSSGT